MRQTLTDQELTVIVRVLDTASQRGVFRGPDLTTVGQIHDKIVSMLPKPKPEADKNDDKK